ncbi:unnamed protein product [Symbiodinium sp. KB8]|nr:unnamed protein product [Symbiodinium sp. KB8]
MKTSGMAQQRTCPAGLLRWKRRRRCVVRGLLLPPAATVTQLPCRFSQAQSAVTDARKRCLRLFGDALGNCVGNVQFQQSARTAQREAAAASRGGVAVERFSMSDLMQAPAARSEPQTPTAVATGFVTTPSVTTPQHTMPAATTPPTRAPTGGTKRPSPTSTALPAPPPAKRTAGAASPLPASDTGAASATAAATSAPGSALPELPGGAAVPPKAQGGGGGSTGTAGSALSLSQDNFQLPDDALKVLQAQEAEAERARRIAASKEAALRRLQASRGGEGQSHSQGSVQL